MVGVYKSIEKANNALTKFYEKRTDNSINYTVKTF